jgi:hypothetical protein
MSFTAPSGTNFRTAPDLTLASLRQALEAIAEFIKSRDTYGYLLRFDDWWEHNGEQMPKGKLSWEAFSDRYENEAAIAASMPKRHEVRVGICGPGMEWYLRYIADPSKDTASLDLTVPAEWEEDFQDLMQGLAPIAWVRSPAEEYYRLIRNGATPVSAGRAASREAAESPGMGETVGAPPANFDGLADNISFGGGFGWLFKGKIVGAAVAAFLLFLGYLMLSNLSYRF